MIPFAEIAAWLPYYQEAQVSPRDWRARIVARQADVRGEAELKAAFDAGVAELGPVDIVLANAGVAIG